MKRPQPRRPGPLPLQKQAELQRARRLEWSTLALRVSVLAALYTALGSSQALAAIWFKSLWSLLPPIAFLTACRLERRKPTPRFPYGFYRATSVAFLASALALVFMGLYLIYTGVQTLVAGTHPALATFADADSLLQWSGWPMILALAWSIAVPFATGGPRQRLAVALHDKGLYADAAMGRASWLGGSAAIIGVLGIGLGFWWADFVATFVIGGDILYHGYRHLDTAVRDLIDEVPRRLGSSTVDPLGTRIRDHLSSLDWIDNASVRLREEGRLLTGVAFVAPNRQDDLVTNLDDARAEIERLDWRLLDFELVPVDASRCSAMVA